MNNQVTITLTVEHLKNDNLWKELVGDNQPITPIEFLHKLFEARQGEKIYIPYPSLLFPK